ncbi:MAG: hypothetical protein K5697_11865 [Lachnospiraceae bacterium]|nr:hypothetical protein [Lachnospiraceae bacterium]
MKTELIYSRNKSDDIEKAIENIDRFRRQYLPLLEGGRGLFAPLRRRIIRRRYAQLISGDQELQLQLESLKEIQRYVEISNLIQDSVLRYHGAVDIRVKEEASEADDACYELNVVTEGYMDDLGSGGSVKIPGIRRSFKLTRHAMEKTFRRGVIDFSWLDDELIDCAQRTAAMCNGMRGFEVKVSGGLPMKEDLPPASFDPGGENPHDIIG